MIVQRLQKVYDNNRDENSVYVRNLLKESLQYLVLNYIYNSKYGKQLVFTGGTCLRFCFDLPRLSEDLDFDIEKETFDFKRLEKDFYKYFRSKLGFKDLSIQIKGRHNLIYLRFPVLDKLGYPIKKPSDKVLFVRLDISFMQTQEHNIKVFLKSSEDFSFLIRHYSLEDLLASKIGAILQRKTKDGEKTIPRFKGRDYYDLFWLIDRGVKPNFNRLFDLTSTKTKKEITESLLVRVNQAIKKKNILKDDLYPFFKNHKFVNNFVNNIDALRSRVETLS